MSGAEWAREWEEQERKREEWQEEEETFLARLTCGKVCISIHVRDFVSEKCQYIVPREHKYSESHCHERVSI